MCKLKSPVELEIWFKRIENNVKCIQECQLMKLFEIKLVKVLVFEHALCEQPRAQPYISPNHLIFDSGADNEKI